MQTRLKRRKRGYIGTVEAELRGIYRHARLYSEDGGDVTPTDFVEVMNAARRALEALGWEVKV